MDTMGTMDAVTTLPGISLAVLGAVHGINPAMGWLFAVSLGLQEERRGAVWAALGPLALGHALAIAVAVMAAAAVGLVVSPDTLKWVVAGLLLAFGVAHLRRHRHPRWGGMKVGGKELTIWSFLMASAHGAGLMALPFVLRALGTGPGGAGRTRFTGAASAGDGMAGPAGGPMAGDGMAEAAGHAGHHALAAGAGLPPDWMVALTSTVVHTAGYLLVTGVVAVIVYEWLGLRLLRSAWINLDALWAAALVVTAVLTPLL